MKSLPKTNIEYLTHHWPVVTGCSFGCPWCWARAATERFPFIHDEKNGPLNHAFCEPLIHHDRLDLPSRRRKPARIGVCFSGDLFGPEVPDEFKTRVFDAMATDVLQPCKHIYLVLTKRAEEMHDFFARYTKRGTEPWPNVWLGVSVTTQADAEERIPLLLQTPAAHRWVSIEPMLGPVDTSPWLNPRHWARGLDWIVIGSIDRPSAQYPAPRREWIENIVEQCRAAGVPVWVKNNVRDKGLWPQQLPEGIV